MTNRHKGKRDHPVELVEQLQIGLTIENKTLVIKLFFIRFSYTWGLIYESECHW